MSKTTASSSTKTPAPPVPPVPTVVEEPADITGTGVEPAVTRSKRKTTKIPIPKKKSKAPAEESSSAEASDDSDSSSDESPSEDEGERQARKKRKKAKKAKKKAKSAEDTAKSMEAKKLAADIVKMMAVAQDPQLMTLPQMGSHAAKRAVATVKAQNILMTKREGTTQTHQALVRGIEVPRGYWRRHKIRMKASGTWSRSWSKRKRLARANKENGRLVIGM